MPKRVIALTDLEIRNARKKDRPYKLADGGGLYLEVLPSGSKIWRMKFRQASGKENKLTFGRYPEISLLAARECRSQARKLLAEGRGQDVEISCTITIDSNGKTTTSCTVKTKVK